MTSTFAPAPTPAAAPAVPTCAAATVRPAATWLLGTRSVPLVPRGA